MNLKALRTEKKYSQQKLATLLRVSRSTVAMWESGASQPDNDALLKIANIFDTSVDYLLGREMPDQESPPRQKGVRIPILGYVPAGIPIEAIEDILGYEEITPEMARNGEHFALKIKGDSMIPDIKDGDIVIVRMQPDVESGETAIVQINGDEATCKRVVKHKTGISIVANNPAYESRFFTNEEIMELPVTVVGKIVELRRSF